MNDQVRAAVLTRPGTLEITEFGPPSLGHHDGLLRPEIAGICGTDCKIFAGEIPAPLPLILGHEIVGQIAEIGEQMAERLDVRRGDRVVVETSVPCWSCRDCWSGEYRFCLRRRAYGINVPTSQVPSLWGALAERMYLAPGSIVHRVPAGMDATRALVATLLANGVEWLTNLGGMRVGDTVVMQGCGPQGLAAVVIARRAGASHIVVTGLPRDEARLALARRLGADTVLDSQIQDVTSAVRDLTGGRGADVVLDVTGAAGSPALSVRLVRSRGTVVLAGLSGGRRSELPLDEVVNRQIRLQGAFVKGDAAFRAALDIADQLGPDHPVDDIVSHRFPLDDASGALKAACGERAPDFVKAAVMT
jgi:alcohol dehydrogenase